jgi:hypothetical protein
MMHSVNQCTQIKKFSLAPPVSKPIPKSTPPLPVFGDIVGAPPSCSSSPSNKGKKRNLEPTDPPIIKSAAIPKKRKTEPPPPRAAQQQQQPEGGPEPFPAMDDPVDVSDEFRHEMTAMLQAEEQCMRDVAIRVDGIRRGNSVLRNMGDPRIVMIVSDIQLASTDGTPSFVNVYTMPEDLEGDDVQAYSDIKVGRQPEVGGMFNNKGRIVRLPQPSKHARSASSSAGISITMYESLRVHITGPTTVKQVLQFAEYSRGMIEVLQQVPITISTLDLNMFNVCFPLGVEIDRNECFDLLNRDRRVINARLQTEQHAAVRYNLFIPDVESQAYPTIMLFQSYTIMIVKRLCTVSRALEHVIEVVNAICGGTASCACADDERPTATKVEEEETTRRPSNEAKVENEETRCPSSSSLEYTDVMAVVKEVEVEVMLNGADSVQAPTTTKAKAKAAYICASWTDSDDEQ